MQFRRDTFGASPIIATVLLVAIVVLMAATIAFVVQRYTDSGQTQPAPKVAFAKEDRSLVVVRADPGLDWFRDIELQGTCAPLLNSAALPLTTGTPVKAGDKLSCLAGTTIAVSTSEEAGDSLLLNAEFS